MKKIYANLKGAMPPEFPDVLLDELPDLAINHPDFKASGWRDDEARPGQQFSVCYEFIGGKWEGFVSVRRTPPRVSL